MANATYRDIGGPEGLLAKRISFTGNSMSAFHTSDAKGNNIYFVKSYDTVIAEVCADGTIDIPDTKYSRTTSRQQNLCRAWL